MGASVRVSFLCVVSLLVSLQAQPVTDSLERSDGDDGAAPVDSKPLEGSTSHWESNNEHKATDEGLPDVEETSGMVDKGSMTTDPGDKAGHEDCSLREENRGLQEHHRMPEGHHVVTLATTVGHGDDRQR